MLLTQALFLDHAIDPSTVFFADAVQKNVKYAHLHHIFPIFINLLLIHIWQVLAAKKNIGSLLSLHTCHFF